MELLNFIDDIFTNPPDIYDGAKFKKSQYTMLIYGFLSNIMGNIFDYSGMSAINEIDLKRAYFYTNYVGYDNELNKFIPLKPAGSRDIYNEYSEFISAIGSVQNKKFSVYDDKRPVGFSRSFYTFSDAYVCFTYAQRLAELLISIDESIVASRILNVFVGSENQLNELKVIYEKINGGVPVHITSEWNEEQAKAIQLLPPTSISEYYNGFRDLLNEFLTVSGLASLVNPNKKERLLTDEIGNNEDIKSTILFDKYQNRKIFLDKINDTYFTNFEINFNVKIGDELDGINNLIKLGGDQDVQDTKID